MISIFLNALIFLLVHSKISPECLWFKNREFSKLREEVNEVNWTEKSGIAKENKMNL